MFIVRFKDHKMKCLLLTNESRLKLTVRYIFNNYSLNRRLILADIYHASVYHKYLLEYIFYFSIYYTSEQQKSGVFTTYERKYLNFVSNLQQAV